MLDRGMQAFDAEMRAGPRPPRRASTRRAEQVDNSSAPGAAALARRIVQFWATAGVAIETEIIRCGGPRESPVFGIRSNLLNALPPQETRDGHG
jgi:hypothetical protein